MKLNYEKDTYSREYVVKLAKELKGEFREDGLFYKIVLPNRKSDD